MKFLGVTTRKVYAWSSDTVPAALLDGNGNPVAKATFNGETIVSCGSGTQDGSVARGTAGTATLQNIYTSALPNPFAPGYAPSTLEQL